MSSELPPTAVPAGIADPVASALAAIEEKANVPKRVSQATSRGVARARVFADRNPSGAALAVAGLALAVGVAVWGAVRLYTR